jgi:hypothetical protein
MHFRQDIDDEDRRIGVLTGKPEGITPEFALGMFLENPQEWRLTHTSEAGEFYFVYSGDPHDEP